MPWEDVVDRLSEKLPYSDGATRRRFIAGAMLIVGVAVPYWSKFSRAVGGVSIVDIIRTPLLAAAAGLLVYVAGTLVEMIGALFLLPAAVFLFRALRLPTQPGIQRRLLSADAARLLDSLPGTIQTGVTQPTGRYADLTAQHLASTFTDSRRRRWCRQLFSRVADLATTTTALICIISPSVVVRALRSTSSTEEARYWTDLASVTQTFDRLRNDKMYLLVWQLVDDLHHLTGQSQPSPESSLAATSETDLYVHLQDTQWSSIDGFVEYVRQRKGGDRIPYWSAEGIDQLRSAFAALERATEEQASRLASISQDILAALTNERDRAIKQSAYRTVVEARQEAERRLTYLSDLPDETARWQATADQVQTGRAERRMLIVIVAALMPSLLFLYAGYLMSLRNAVLNAIEALAIEKRIEPERVSLVGVQDFEQAR